MLQILKPDLATAAVRTEGLWVAHYSHMTLDTCQGGVKQAGVGQEAQLAVFLVLAWLDVPHSADEHCSVLAPWQQVTNVNTRKKITLC